MKHHFLGHTDIKVPEICLGTMTFGQQNTQEQAFEQLDYALERGINFWDTAELYAVPPTPQSYGSTETILGNWFAKTGKRKQVTLASKIAGPSQVGGHIRNGQTRFNKKDISRALDNSLKRLQTDYLDLYQLHWPERPTNCFSHLGYTTQMIADTPADLTPLAETLIALNDEIKAGRIRAIGLSNETPWGTMKFLQLADELGLQRVVSVQNPYGLLNRTYEIGLAEIAHFEKVGCLAYSPLGFGVLSGKYLNDQKPENARITLFPRFSRYTNAQAVWATEQYAKIAAEQGLSLVQLSLAFVRQQFFVTSTIIGATTMQQLQENIDSVDVALSDEVMQLIEAVHVQQPNPSP
ncbi:aldo/keto reductase [Alkanindiges hydrocarboniclasticus]|jgi:aryl-alcohol dehydrogenase-like predicted oxidoreductase|uniref:Protein tas n=1 Tax=Alkanindiges hydrocarboniclasticus TaxID=1907941 RepID=A0A1S8CSL4_9GAMM|nr:NADP(H)-dependent aldo-keto reductase [Alkanindiges hydrocarboniclasticus]ONG38982.1 aldo/keto reductase [Alkanindiges hydrocarboniclasticus]